MSIVDLLKFTRVLVVLNNTTEVLPKKKFTTKVTPCNENELAKGYEKKESAGKKISRSSAFRKNF
jgi:hypothetical protein